MVKVLLLLLSAVFLSLCWFLTNYYGGVFAQKINHVVRLYRAEVGFCTSHSAALGLILGALKIFFILDEAEICQRGCLK